MQQNPFNENEHGQDKIKSKEVLYKEIAQLATELIAGPNIFPFPGMNQTSYQTFKSTEQDYLEFVTPIDELLKKFESEQIKLSFGENPAQTDIFVMSTNSESVKYDSIPVGDLDPENVSDEKLKKIILLGKQIRELN